MKTLPLDAKETTLRRVLKEAQRQKLVFLTFEGATRYVVALADEGDREICALRSNAEFMAHLSGLEKRARTHPRKTLSQIRERFADRHIKGR